jgi:hypothetical protein
MANSCASVDTTGTADGEKHDMICGPQAPVMLSAFATNPVESGQTRITLRPNEHPDNTLLAPARKGLPCLTVHGFRSCTLCSAKHLLRSIA